MDLEGQHRPVPIDHERFATYIRPSGGVWSNVRDMARYVIAELGGGALPGGGRVASEQNLTYRRQPQVKIDADSAYGLGWTTGKTKGLRVVTHGGGTMGFATTVAFYPEKGLGVVMIANGTGGHLAEAMIRARLLELWFGFDDHAADRLAHAVAEQKKTLVELKGRLSPLTAEHAARVVGTYHNDEIGAIVIGTTNGALTAAIGAYRTRLLRHARQDGKQALMFTDPPLAGVELVLRADGSLELARGQERYLFTPPAKR
jgi:hypothetical protein